MHYQIWIPAGGTLESVGLADLASDEKPLEFESDGPGDRRGKLFGWDVLGGRRGHGSSGVYAPDRQTWLPAPPDGELAAGRYWYGIENVAPPAPEDLARTPLHSGEELALADGQTWTIPVAERVPHRWGLDPATGQFCRTPEARYQAFCQRAGKFYSQVMDPQHVGDVTIGDGWEFACMALAINYRVNAAIVAWLGLINDAVASPILLATVEMTAIRAVEDEKKNPG